MFLSFNIDMLCLTHKISDRLVSCAKRNFVARVFALFTVLLVCGSATAAESGRMIPNPAVDEPLAKVSGEQTAVFAGGCFWGIQAVFQHVQGVVSATSGYSGGSAGEAQYEAVSTGNTGHAESVKVVFDPAKVSYGQLLKVFFSVAHDPTQLNRQGPDIGTQYRSAIFFASDGQKRIASAYIDQLEKAKIYSEPIVTKLTPLLAFYPAEAYHQNYVALHPNELYIIFNDLPKLAGLKAQFPALYRTESHN